MAKFKINTIFRVTNRGQVLAGELIEGIIDQNMLIELNDGSILKIKSIEAVNHGKGISSIGLIVEFTKESINHIVGQTVVIQ